MNDAERQRSGGSSGDASGHASTRGAQRGRGGERENDAGGPSGGTGGGGPQPHRGKGRASADTPTSEWIVAGFGALLVLATVAILVFEAIDEGSRVPEISVRVDTVVALPGGEYVARITAENAGDETAATLRLEGIHRLDGETQVSSITLDYLPPRSSRAAGLIFQRDPRRGELILLPRSYREP